MATLTPGGFLEVLGRGSIQAGVLVVVVLLAQWLFGNRLAPRWRCALWLLVMIRLLLPVSVGSVVSLFNLTPYLENMQPAAQPHLASPEAKPIAQNSLTLPVAQAAPGMVSEAQSEIVPNQNNEIVPVVSQPSADSRIEAKPVAPVPLKISWPFILFAIWLAGVLILGFYVFASSFRINRCFAKLEPITDPDLLTLLRDCQERLRVRGNLSISESVDIATPALYGFLKPKLLLPRGFVSRFSPKELRFILLHELAHVKRRDILFNWRAAMLQIVHWFNPVIWFGFARWRADCELVCDAIALETAGAEHNKDYGQTILRLLENFTRRSTVPGLVGILEDKKQLQRRIRMIVGFRPGRKLGLVSAALFAGLSLVCLTDAQNKISVTDKNADLLATTQAVHETGIPARPVVTNGPAMKVTVLDDTIGQPLDNAEVFAPNESSFFGGRENAPRWLTDKGGIATILLGESPTNSMGQMTWFTLSARKEGYAPFGMSWSDGSKDVRPGLPKKITLRLKRGINVGGVVVNEAGVPQSGIQVRVFGSGYSYDRGQETNQSYAEFWNDSAGIVLPVTDSAGLWQVKDFPPDLQNVAFEFVRTDGSVARFRHPDVAENMNEPQGDPMDFAAFLSGNARFVLKSGDELHGLTVDPQGRPLPDVRIQIGYGMVNRERAGEASSDASGHFVLRHLNHRQVILTADKAGFSITSIIVDLPSNLPELRLQLGELKPLRIHVVDGNGQPIAGAKVTTDTYRTEGQLLDFAGTTDQQGNLTWTNAPVSDFALVATSPASSALQQKIRLTPNQREVTFHLRAGMDKEIIVNGQVRDAKTGAPVKLDSVKYQTGDREGFRWAAEVSESGFHLPLPATRFRPGMYPSYQLQLNAAGYGILTTSWRDFDEGDWDASFELQPAGVAGGTVLLPDGSPAAGARIWTRAEDVDGTLFINRPDAYYGNRMIKAQADANGKFILPDVPDDQPVIFTDAKGFLSTTIADVKSHPNVSLQPWGRVTGVLKIAGKPKGGAAVNLATLLWFPKIGFNLDYSTFTAPDGSFTFEHVPPGEYKLYHHRTKTGIITEDHQMPLVVKAGETTNIEYSNPGRTLIGQLVSDKPEIEVDWLNDDDTLTLKQPPLAPVSVNPKDYATEQGFQEAYNKSYQSPEKLEQARDARTYVLGFETDGSFRADDVPPGTYDLKIKVTKPDPNSRNNEFNARDELGSLTREVVVPPSDAPLDLGTLTLAMKGDTSGKKPATVNFSATTLGGQPISLAQFKGKYVVLAFWAVWSDRSTDQLKELQKLQANLKDDPRVTFLGVSLDEKTVAIAKAIAARGYQWTQAMIDSTNLANVTATFDVTSLPAICLIDPNGRIIAHDLSGDRLSAAVQRVLQKK